MKCPKCGIEVVKGEKACWQCYAPLDGSGAARQPGAAPQVSAARPSAAARKSGSRRLPIAIVALLVLAAGGGYFYYSQYLSPVACARAFCSALERGDGKAFHALLTSEDRKQASPQEIESMMAMMNSDGGVKLKMTVKDVSRDGSGARANVSYEMSMGGGGNAPSFSMTVPLMMVREGIGWRVSMEKTTEEQMKSMRMSQDMFTQPGGGMPAPAQ